MGSEYIKLLWKRIRLPVFLLFSTFFLGSIGYKIIYPEVSWLKVIFMTAITISTVGYEDMLDVEHSVIGEIYTIILIITGMGTVLYAVSSVTAFIVEGELKNILTEHSKFRRLKKMKNHTIICGAGDTGYQVIRELKLRNEQCVVIDLDINVLEMIKKDFPDFIYISKDATEESTLKEAKIETAKSLVATLSNDKDNLFLVITARFLNPDLKIISRAIDLSIESKLIRAGANYVVSPNYIGGMRIASMLLRPHAVSFLDRMLKDPAGNFRVDEIIVEEGSYLAGKTFKESNIPHYVGVYIFAYFPEIGGQCIYNPDPDQRIHPNSVLIFIGNPEQHKRIQEMSKKEMYYIVTEKISNSIIKQN